MKKICVFAGTTEGKQLIEFLQSFPCQVVACVATEYGEVCLEHTRAIIKQGRMNQLQMGQFFQEHDFDMILDATHPYAQIVSENIIGAAQQTKQQYYRINRALSQYQGVSDIQQAIAYLNTIEGNILLTTGSKDLKQFKQITQFEKRVYVRVLPTQTSLQECIEVGVNTANIIAMQGPFGTLLNEGMIQQYAIKAVVTKNSGKQGGFEEKLTACHRQNIPCVVVNPPALIDGVSYEEMITILQQELGDCDKLGAYGKKTLHLIGFGTGDLKHLTKESLQALENSDVIVGAPRLLESCRHLGKISYCGYTAKEVQKAVQQNPHCKEIALIVSGDIGFYSAAKEIYQHFSDWTIRNYCGISTPIYFAAQLKMPWQDMRFISLHGRGCNVVAEVQRHPRVFCLTGGDNTVSAIAQKFCDYQMQDLKLYIGENLGMDDQKITLCSPQEAAQKTFSTLSAMIVENFSPRANFIGVRDAEFCRLEKVPMTKEDIRGLSLLKMGIQNESVIYDIGAGSGSVSVEMALFSPSSTVYAIEKNEKALPLLQQNKLDFKVDNMTIVQGLAPTVLENLPPPTHVFIGGSSGQMQEIFEVLIEKNPMVKIVVNVIALETLSQIMTVIKQMKMDYDVTCVQIAKAKKVADYSMMMGQNPIYIIECQKKVVSC